MTFLGGAAIASPIGALAQQTTNVPRVGILSDESPSVGSESFEPFAQGLRELGWIEGRNIVFEHRSAKRKNEILPSLAAELVRLEPNVILAIGTPAARAAKGATQTIPIVFARKYPAVGRPDGQGSAPDDVLSEGVCRGGRPDVLRHELL